MGRILHEAVGGDKALTAREVQGEIPGMGESAVSDTEADEMGKHLRGLGYIEWEERMANELSGELADLVLAALDHGVDSVREGGPLIPFVMSDTGSERTLARFVAERLEDGVAQAVAHVAAKRDETGTRHALVYDSYLTLPSEGRSDAIYAEGVEAGSDGVMILVQRYRPKRALRRFDTIGNPALLPGPGNLT